MNKAELVSEIAAGANISKSAAERALDTATGTITNTLKSGGKVTLVGFGTFASANRAARTGRNPQTGATINIPARRVPTFKAGKGLKSSVN
jgi:DNA-binding protein HU-beta